MSLPGLSTQLIRYHSTKTLIQEAASGKEWRTTFYAHARMKYQMVFDFLRNAPPYQEMNRITNFLSRHIGAFDSFLLDDPDDDQVGESPFGIGHLDPMTGLAVLIFQLQRAQFSPVEDGLGLLPQVTHPRKNILPNSNLFTGGNWAVVNGSIQSACGVAPDNTFTASRLFTTGACTLTGTAAAVGVSFPGCADSFWVRSDKGGDVGLGLLNGQGDLTGSVIKGNATMPFGSTVTSGSGPVVFRLKAGEWCRIAVSGGMNVAGSAGVILYVNEGSPGDSVFLWNSQVQLGTVVTPDIITGSTPVTAFPDVWPGVGDGFEPVYDVRQAAPSEMYGFPSAWGSGRLELASPDSTPSRYSADVWGPRAPYGASRTNLCRWSNDLTQWTAASGGTGSSPSSTALFANVPSGVGTNGPKVATRVQFNKGTGLTSADKSTVALSMGLSTTLPVVTQTLWAKTNDGSLVSLFLTIDSAGTMLLSVGPNWQKFQVQALNVSTGLVTIGLRGDLTPFNTADTSIVWVQSEPGDVATQVIPTNGSVVTAPPEYVGSPTVYLQDDQNPHPVMLAPWPRTNLVGASGLGTGLSDPMGTGLAAVSGGFSATASGAVSGGPLTVSFWVQAGSTQSFTAGVSGANTTVDVVLPDGTDLGPKVTRQGSAVLSAFFEALPPDPYVGSGRAAGWFRAYITVVAPSGSPTAVCTASGGNLGLFGPHAEVGFTCGWYINGGSPQTDYTIDQFGVVTFTAAPLGAAVAPSVPLNGVLTWVGGYYRRVRFDGDDQEIDMLLPNLWSVQQINLVTVKP